MSKNLLNKIILGTAQFNDGYGRFNKNYVGDKEILKILSSSKCTKLEFIDNHH